MTTKYQKSSTDLSTIFAAYVPGQTRASTTHYDVNGADLNTLFAKLSYGSAATATGYSIGGNDLSTIFAAFGTVPQAQANAVFSSSGNPITGIASDGTSQIVVVGYGGEAGHNTLAYSSNGNSTTATFSYPSGSAGNIPYTYASFNDVCYVSGTGNSSIFNVAAVITSDEGQDMTPVWTTNGGSTWSYGNNVASPGNEGAFNIASNGTDIVMCNNTYLNSGKFAYCTTPSSQSTSWIAASYSLNISVGLSQVRGSLEYVNGNFIALNSSGYSGNIGTGPCYLYSITGSSWTSAAANNGSAGGLADVAYGAGIYVFVGRTNENAAYIGHLPAIGSTSTYATPTISTWPGTGTAVNCVVWIASISTFIAADNKGNFAYSNSSVGTPGIDWALILVTPSVVGSTSINCGCVCGAYTYWGTANGYILQLANSAIP